MNTFRSELTPLAFLGRSAEVFPDKPAVVHGELRQTWAEFAREVTGAANAMRGAGIGPGDRVAVLAPNLPIQLVAHFAVPLAGAVLVEINTRLAPAEVRYILDHSGARLLLVDESLLSTVDAIGALPATLGEVVVVGAAAAGRRTYAQLLADGSDDPLPWAVPDETATLSINYTSGTTGRPKGVMYSHRGAYLNALGEVIHSGFTPDTGYLWTLPLFHCNGWCTAWAVTAAGGTHVCLRAVDPAEIWRLLDSERISHLSGAPTVLVGIAAAEQAHRLDRPLTVTTAGAPPSPTVIGRLEELGARIVHVYGLTETYGPYTVCEYQPGWEDAPAADRARLLARQGVGMVQADRVRVVDPQLRDVPADGETMGEIVMRGNNVMTGYHADPEATAEAFRGGWFHSGDLGVRHPDSYVELRDRAKDVIVSGGENISTVEVERAVDSHPAVLEVAVVGVPDERWGERPKAFVVVRDGATATEAEIIEHVRGLIAKFKAPEHVEFVAELPKTSTGKIRKYELRAAEWGHATTRIRG